MGRIAMQCPGCFSINMIEGGNDADFECDCGEKLTVIDLRSAERFSDPPAVVEQFYPLSPREALLAIRWHLAGLQVDTGRDLKVGHIDRLASDGLRPFDPQTFDITDVLADRLAQAHGVLRQLLDMAPEGESERQMHEDAAMALSLPPNIEAMVERRLGS